MSRIIELGAPGEFDLDALSVFLRLQIFVGEDTPFQQVRQLPPGAKLVWSGGQVQLESQRPCPSPVRLSREETVEAYVELFRQAIRRRLPLDDRQEIVLPLSGGQDSRHIFLELLAQGRPPTRCVTVARDWSPKLMDDARLATEVAGLDRVSHTVLMQDDSIFESEFRKNILTNFCTLEHAWFLSLVDHGDLSGVLVFDGLGGDILSACLLLHKDLLKLYQEGNVTRLADHFLGEERAFRNALSPTFYAQVNRERAIRRLAAELERHAGTLNPLTEFYFWNRTRRSTALSPYAILNRSTTVDTPYLDHNLFDFLIARPPEFLDPNFHKRAMKTAYPRYAEIPFSELSAPLADRPQPFVLFARQLSRWLLSTPAENLGLLRKAYLIPRLSRCLIDPKYAQTALWLPQLVLYLAQLNSLALRGRSCGILKPSPSQMEC